MKYTHTRHMYHLLMLAQNFADCERRYPKTSKTAGIPDSGSDAEAFKHKCGAADAPPLFITLAVSNSTHPSVTAADN